MDILGRIKIGTTLTPKSDGSTIRMGYAVVLECNPLPDYMLNLPDAYDHECLYRILTDFGNTADLTLRELISIYEFGEVDAIKTRCQTIISNHMKVLEGLSEG